MTTNLTVKSVQVSDGNEIIPTVTLVFLTPAGEEKISCASQSGENIYDAIFKATKQIISSHFPKINGQEVKLLSCGGVSPYKGGCKAHAHIRLGVEKNGRSSKRGGWHENNLHLAIARVILNCFRDITN